MKRRFQSSRLAFGQLACGVVVCGALAAVGCHERAAPDPKPKSSEVQQVRRDFNALAEPAEAADSSDAEDAGEDAS